MTKLIQLLSINVLVCTLAVADGLSLKARAWEKKQIAAITKEYKDATKMIEDELVAIDQWTKAEEKKIDGLNNSPIDKKILKEYIQNERKLRLDAVGRYAYPLAVEFNERNIAIQTIVDQAIKKGIENRYKQATGKAVDETFSAQNQTLYKFDGIVRAEKQRRTNSYYDATATLKRAVDTSLTDDNEYKGKTVIASIRMEGKEIPEPLSKQIWNAYFAARNGDWQNLLQPTTGGNLYYTERSTGKSYRVHLQYFYRLKDGRNQEITAQKPAPKPAPAPVIQSGNSEPPPIIRNGNPSPSTPVPTQPLPKREEDRFDPKKGPAPKGSPYNPSTVPPATAPPPKLVENSNPETPTAPDQKPDPKTDPKTEPKKEEPPPPLEPAYEPETIEELEQYSRAKVYYHHVYKPLVTRFETQLENKRRDTIGLGSPIKTVLDSKPSDLEPFRQENDVGIFDRFGRNIKRHGITLVDWEGHIANPSMKVFLTPPTTARLPLAVQLRGDNPRMNFNVPSRVAEGGPKKIVVFTDRNQKIPVYIGLWPNRDPKTPPMELNISYWEIGREPATERAAQELEVPARTTTFKLEIKVDDRDEDKPQKPQPIVQAKNYLFPSPVSDDTSRLIAPFPYSTERINISHPDSFSIVIDFSRDKSGFFTDPERNKTLKHDIVRQAAQDWAYFIDHMQWGPIEQGREVTALLRTEEPDNKSLVNARNQYSYKDIMIYMQGNVKETIAAAKGGATGIDHNNRSEVNFTNVRSGRVDFEGVQDDKNYFFDLNDQKWFEADYNISKPVDLYSLTLHEIGHVLFANNSHPVFKAWIRDNAGLASDVAVEEYQQSSPKMDEFHHFPETYDFASKRGAYGFVRTPKIPGIMPHYRWLLTKLDIVMLQAIGYKIKNFSFLKPLDWQFRNLTEAQVGKIYTDKFRATGGMSDYFFQIESGRLPDGLSLDSRTGEISGIARHAGRYQFVISLREDSDSTAAPMTFAFMLIVRD